MSALAKIDFEDTEGAYLEQLILKIVYLFHLPKSAKDRTSASSRESIMLTCILASLCESCYQMLRLVDAVCWGGCLLSRCLLSWRIPRLKELTPSCCFLFSSASASHHITWATHSSYQREVKHISFAISITQLGHSPYNYAGAVWFQYYTHAHTHIQEEIKMNYAHSLHSLMPELMHL